MKHHYQRVLLKVTLLLAVAFTLAITSQAQCVLVGTNEQGAIVKTECSCDFPVYVKTGDESHQAADDQTFIDAKSAWATSKADLYKLLTTLTDWYFIIPGADLQLMDQNRQYYIKASPDQYHVVD